MTQPGIMLPGATNDLSARISETVGRPPDRRTGLVVSFTNNQLMVSVGGGAAQQVGYIDTYTPLVGDTVILILQRSTWVCIGRLADTGATVPIRSGEILGGVLAVNFAEVVFAGSADNQLPGYSFTATLVQGHLIEILATFIVANNTTAADFPAVKIKQDGALMRATYTYCNAGHVYAANRLTHWFVANNSDAHTYTFTGARLFGAATFNLGHDPGDCFVAIDHGVPQNLTIV